MRFYPVLPKITQSIAKIIIKVLHNGVKAFTIQMYY